MSAAPSPTTPAFDTTHAEVYDRQFEPIRALKDAMHLVLRMQFLRLPPDAHILVAGAGTGAEVRFLAPLFPQWRFTLVDPAPAMLEVARRHAEAEGFADRCTFHVGFVSSLPLQAHDAATSVLVSHFLTNASERQSFFGDIAARLKPGGLLFNADLCADRDDPTFADVLDLWLRMLEHSGVPEERRAAWVTSFGQAFAAHGPAEVASMITSAGFTQPAACYQIALIRGWVARRG